MTRKQSGFTLIELIAVLVILGILAATAVPRFVDLSDEAIQASVNSLAGSLESASALNHAVDIATEAGLTSDPFTEIDDCTEVESLLSKTLTADYTISGGAIPDKGTVTCTLTHTNGDSAGFAAIGACNGATCS